MKKEVIPAEDISSIIEGDPLTLEELEELTWGD